MESQFYSLLPESVKSLVKEIEIKLGSEIIIRAKDKDASGRVKEPSGTRLSVSTSSGSVKAEILYGDDVSVLVSSLPLRSMVHEILHIHRIVVSETIGVIRNPKQPEEYIEFADRLTNDIDHFHFLRTEIAACPESQLTWENRFNELLVMHGPAFQDTNLNPKNTCKLRQYLVAIWFVASPNMPSWKGLAQLQSMLKQKGWFSDAEEAVRVFQGASDKNIANCISTFIKASGLDPKDFQQTKLNIAGVKYDISLLP